MPHNNFPNITFSCSYCTIAFSNKYNCAKHTIRDSYYFLSQWSHIYLVGVSAICILLGKWGLSLSQRYNDMEGSNLWLSHFALQNKFHIIGREKRNKNKIEVKKNIGIYVENRKNQNTLKKSTTKKINGNFINLSLHSKPFYQYAHQSRTKKIIP